MKNNINKHTEIKDDNEKYSYLNRLIMAEAMRGNTDVLGPIDINWKVTNHFVFVFITEYTGRWWYRLLISPGEFTYERKAVLYPPREDNSLFYVYGCFENIQGDELEVQQWVRGD